MDYQRRRAMLASLAAVIAPLTQAMAGGRSAYRQVLTQYIYSTQNKPMNNKLYDIAIVGGASAGLAAALTAGRTNRKTIVFDTGEPRNKPATHAHNIFTRDGQPPLELLAIGRQQLVQYTSVELKSEYVLSAEKTNNAFSLSTANGAHYSARKIILATGVRDILPAIPGLQQLWGSKVLHCPYCHGWEVRNTPVALIGNGETASHLAAIVHNLNPQLTIFTNEASSIIAEKRDLLERKGVRIVETAIDNIADVHNGIRITLADGSVQHFSAAYARAERLHFNNQLAVQLGCELTEAGSVQVDDLQQTTVHGVFAAGDLSHPGLHQVAIAAAGGHKAAALCNNQLCEEDLHA